MSDSSFWRDLEAQFRPLDQVGELRADWDYVAGSGGRGNWRITGTTNTTLRLHFERLARLAGAAVDETNKQDSLQVWLDTLRKRSPGFEFGAQYVEQNDDGSKGACHIRGRTTRLAEAPANLCVELDIEAIEAERGCLPQAEGVTDVRGPTQVLDAHPTSASATSANSIPQGNTPAQVPKPMKRTSTYQAVDEVGRHIAPSQPRSLGDGFYASDGRVVPSHAEPSDEVSVDLNAAQAEDPVKASEAAEPDPELEELIADFSRTPTGIELYQPAVPMMERPGQAAAPSLSRKERLKRLRALRMQADLDLDSQNEYWLLFWPEWMEQHPGEEYSHVSASPASPTDLVKNREPPLGGDKGMVPATQSHAPGKPNKGDLKILRHSNGDLKSTVTLVAAAHFGGVGRRAIQKALAKGSLGAIGARQNRRVTVESLLKYFPSEK
jgi:hypothetical protein